MILQALVDYYELLAEDEESEIPKRYYGKTGVSYELRINKQGELVDVISLKTMVEKKEAARKMTVPEPVLRTAGISANFLCDNSSYVLGFDNKGKPKRSAECFEDFKKLNISILSKVECDEADAVIAFLNSWDTASAAKNPLIAPFINDIYKGANFVFKLDGKTTWVHENEQIRKQWEFYRDKKASNIEMPCLVTGKKLPIARTHPFIKGIHGGQAMGNSLVNFNCSAYESYGRENAQGLNSPVSEYAAFAYAAALNYLLAGSNKMYLGDTTVVFWAQTEGNMHAEVFSGSCNPDNDSKFDPAAEKAIKNIFQSIAAGKQPNIGEHIDESIRFYIAGLSPNAARVSLRFFMADTFGYFMQNIIKHYQALRISKQYSTDKDNFSIWVLLNETVSKNSSKKAVSPLLAGSVFRAIMLGEKYPTALYNAILLRIRAEHEVNFYKAAAIKAYLLRNCLNKNYEEVLGVSLNETSKNKPYVLGRLFAVLEKAQLEAAGGSLNSTIKDKYFTSACTTPAVVFPGLLKIASHNTSKLDYGFVYEKKIGEIFELLNVDDNPYPKNLTYEEQGLFILGYYHQKNALYAKKEEK